MARPSPLMHNSSPALALIGWGGLVHQAGGGGLDDGLTTTRLRRKHIDKKLKQKKKRKN